MKTKDGMTSRCARRCSRKHARERHRRRHCVSRHSGLRRQLQDSQRRRATFFARPADDAVRRGQLKIDCAPLCSFLDDMVLQGLVVLSYVEDDQIYPQSSRSRTQEGGAPMKLEGKALKCCAFISARTISWRDKPLYRAYRWAVAASWISEALPSSAESKVTA